MGGNNFRLNVDLNVINHLGVGLYSSTPAALTELVANAWDAEAKEVYISIDPSNRKITIEDDGHGMDANSIRDKFLNVGYSRRSKTTQKNLSESGLRRVMGRKGIGKLAMFALANQIEVTSQVDGEPPISFKIDVPELRKSLEQSNDGAYLEEIKGSTLRGSSGTRIILSEVLRGLNTSESYLRTKLARRFSILGDTFNFKVFLNNKEITRVDRNFYDHVQFLWAFDKEAAASVKAIAKNIEKVSDDEGQDVDCIQMLSGLVKVEDKDYPVKGYIASVFQPKNLGSKDDSANMLSIFANGRVFAENVLTEANSAKYYQNYLVGEIHADFLDDDDVDRATASREAIKRDDPKYQALLGFIRTSLEGVGNKWDEWRILLGLDPDEKSNAGVIEWLDTLKDKRDLVAAKKIMTSIQNSTIHSDEVKNLNAKKLLFRGAIIGFEKLRIRKQLDKLDEVDDVLSPEFASIFTALSEVEESAYFDITKTRLEIIKKFKDIAANQDALEKVAQQYLFDHLWLLDPSWDRVTGRAEMEKTLTQYIKEQNPDATGARLDITYRASSGRHIVVELKRPKKIIAYDDLSKQVRKYRQALDLYYKKNYPNDPQPPIDIYVLISQTPSDFSEEDRQALAKQNGQIITYQQLINDANNAYQQYLDAGELTGKLEGILEKI